MAGMGAAKQGWHRKGGARETLRLEPSWRDQGRGAHENGAGGGSDNPHTAAGAREHRGVRRREIT